MPHSVLALTMAVSPHDSGVRQVAALAARLAYVMTCLSLCWGVFCATGWTHRLTGRAATRSSHLVLATLALAFGCLHAVTFLFLTDQRFTPVLLAIPFTGQLRWTAGIIGIELMLAIGFSMLVQRFIPYRRWLWLHRLAYPAVLLIVGHSLFGAIANGHLAVVWLGGLTVLAPTVLLAVLRFVPAKALDEAGLVAERV